MFVSYAQNFEDIILWNALKGHGAGPYVDVGAWDPDIDSVSRAFHERGWPGLHVEPLAEMAARLQRSRPGDQVIAAAVAANQGSIELHVVGGTGLTTVVPAAAEAARARGFSVRTVSVPAVTLASILDRFVGVDVRWLKIDVEGAEEACLRTLSASTVRPWIVVVEATEPNSTTPSFAEWEPHLTGSGYRFALDDGLNRYYVAEASPVDPADVRSPNVFDGFTISPDSSALGAAARSALDGLVAERDGLVAE